MKRVFTISLLTILFPFGACAQKVDNTPVAALDLQRYLGTWYEIARYDHSFERGMDNVQALYTLTDEGTVRVENTGWKDGEFKRSIGKAFLPEPEEQPAWLRVSFFGPFYSDYRVMMLSEDYEYALVGSKSDKYLWILSRIPAVPDEVLSSIIVEAQRRGYDTYKLIWVPQEEASQYE